MPGVGAELLARAFAATSTVSLITDAAQNILHVSAAFTAITGYSEDEIVGTNCRLLQGSGSSDAVRGSIRHALEAGDGFEGDILNYRKDGSPFWNGLSIVPLRDPAGVITHFVSVQRDINTRIALQEQLDFQAGHDAVTGLPNRFGFESYLQGRSTDAAPTGRPDRAGFGLIALEHVGQVRHSFGFSGADDVLAEFACRLKSRLRGGDYLASFSGDQFVVVLEGLCDDASPELAARLQRLHEVVETPFPVDDESVMLGMTMGITPFPARSSGPHVLRLASQALPGPGSDLSRPDSWWRLAPTGPIVEWDTTMAASDFRRGERSRVHRERLFAGGLSMYMQPIIRLFDGTLRRVEALARLTLADGTVVPPDSFVQQLSSNDLDELFRIGLNDALGWVARWEQDGLALDVSVNLAPSTLRHPRCTRWVANALRRHGLAPNRLSLELLETQELDAAASRSVLEELTGLGVGLALDDLGSGHSSLKRLAQLPFDSIKIDRGLLAGVATKPVETLSLIATLSQMGRDMGAAVVLEGIENAGLAEAASVLGASLGQGYYFARPMPAADVPSWAAGFGLPEGFHLPDQSGQLHTELGALAYHWQYTRWGSPHPFSIDDCPLTEFIADRVMAGSAPSLWHDVQHGLGGDDRASGLLLDWLVDASTGQTGGLRARA
ncbi:EAL domain-containing protein [Cryobacterium sp. GrIS_2_6]|uniref:EAL domain-containing protein n=1 Tax=Cryobacterium sp. GrIS_2_6 TaxID=3162785 RepID=UPI002DFD0946|nr:PAS domain S-box-containing protein/diguanylate cyclase (GGDEF)-like protein [Cryobacterium psychrotolerans]